MNTGFRKVSALFASLALVGAGAVTMLATPASASTPTLCENGCNIGGETAATPNATAGEELGIQFTLSEKGTIYQACYPVDSPDPGTDMMTVWHNGVAIAGPQAANGLGCTTFTTAYNQPAGIYAVTFRALAHFNDNGVTPATTVGDVTNITGAVGASYGTAPSATPAIGFGVSVSVYSTPAPPSPVSLTATGTTTATFAFTGDSFGGNTPWTCSASVGTVTPPSGTGTDGSNSVSLTGMTAGNNQITCHVHEVYGSSIGPDATVSTFLVPPAPTGVSVTQSSATSVNVGFTGDGAPGAVFKATCTSSLPGVGSRVGSSTTSPISVTGFPTDPNQVITCAVTETAHSLTSAASSNGSTVNNPTSGLGCDGGKLAAPTQLSAAAEAFPGAVVSWAPVTVSPANCLAGYLVTPSTGTAKFVPGGGTTTKISPLAFGSSVSFTVAAVTGSGVGPSASIGPVTIGTPAPATSVHVAHVAKGAVKVAFKAGASNGAAIKRFTATCGSKSASGTASPLVVKGLTAGKTYTCTVTATNSRGTGAAARSAAVKG